MATLDDAKAAMRQLIDRLLWNLPEGYESVEDALADMPQLHAARNVLLREIDAALAILAYYGDEVNYIQVMGRASRVQEGEGFPARHVLGRIAQAREGATDGDA